MEKYFAKFGVPISVVVVIIVIVVVIVLTIITVKSTKDNNSTLTYMPNESLVKEKYLLSFDKDRNYIKIKIGDIYAYADNLIKKIEDEILIDISDGYIQRIVNSFINSNTTKTVIDKMFTAKYDNVINKFMVKYEQKVTGTISIPQIPTNNTNPSVDSVLTKAQKFLDTNTMNRSVRVAPELYNIWSKERVMTGWGNRKAGTFIFSAMPSDLGKGLMAGYKNTGQDTPPMIQISPFYAIT